LIRQQKQGWTCHVLKHDGLLPDEIIDVRRQIRDPISSPQQVGEHYIYVPVIWSFGTSFI